MKISLEHGSRWRIILADGTQRIFKVSLANGYPEYIFEDDSSVKNSLPPYTDLERIG